jgi:Tfp pilus assembly protein PilO
MDRFIGSGKADRMWLAGGAAGAALLVAIAWFFLISPQHGQAATLRDQTATAQGQVTVLRHRLNQLREQNTRLSVYKGQLAAYQAALPTEPRLSDFLRQVQAAGDTAAVSVEGVTVGQPTSVPGDGKAYSLQVSLTADGTAEKLGTFLDQLQRVAPRAVLVTNAGTAVNARTGALTLTLVMQVFVAQLGTG